MSSYNPEVEKVLDSLAELCCEALSGENANLPERAEPLLKSLLMSGFQRQDKAPLQAELEDRMGAKCRDSVMHRGAERTGLTGKLQKQFDELVRWHSHQPQKGSPAKSANISSATDA